MHDHVQKISTLLQKLKFEETIRNLTFGHNLDKNENLLLLNSSLKQNFFQFLKNNFRANSIFFQSSTHFTSPLKPKLLAEILKRSHNSEFFFLPIRRHSD